jgi:AcrR family transcriptional regulator
MSPMGRPRRAERPDASREHLLAAAIDCFARFGYQGTSIDRIARHAGVTKGALYYHFRDKEELLFEAVGGRVGEFEQHVLAEVGPAQSAVASLRRVIDTCFFHATVSKHRRFIITLMIEALDTNPQLSARFQRILRRMRFFLADIVRRGQADGSVRPDVDPQETAALIAGAIMGAEIQHYQDPEEIELRRVLDTLVAQLADWLTPRSRAVATTGGISA